MAFLLASVHPGACAAHSVLVVLALGSRSAGRVGVQDLSSLRRFENRLYQSDGWRRGGYCYGCFVSRFDLGLRILDHIELSLNRLWHPFNVVVKEVHKFVSSNTCDIVGRLPVI